MDDEAIRRLVRSQPIPDRLFRDLRKAQFVSDPLEFNRLKFNITETPLSPREIDVLRALGDGGLQASEVAEVLGIGVDTVKTYIKTAKAKLRAKNTTQAVARAIRNDLI